MNIHHERIASLDELEVYLETHEAARSIHEYEPDGEFYDRHVEDRSQCTLCVLLDVMRATLLLEDPSG